MDDKKIRTFEIITTDGRNGSPLEEQDEFQDFVTTFRQSSKKKFFEKKMSLRCRRRNERRTRLRSGRRPKLTELPNDVILMIYDHMQNDPVVCVLCQMLYKLFGASGSCAPALPSSTDSWLKEHYGFWDCTPHELIESRLEARCKFCAVYGRGAGYRSKVNRMKFPA